MLKITVVVEGTEKPKYDWQSTPRLEASVSKEGATIKMPCRRNVANVKFDPKELAAFARTIERAAKMLAEGDE